MAPGKIAMRLFPYILLAYIALGVQVGLGPFVEWHGARPNLVLLAVVFIAVNAPRDAAALGCFGMGLLQDLMSADPPGLNAMAYGVVALILGSTQSTVYRSHPLTHVSLAAVGAVIWVAVRGFHALIWSRSGEGEGMPPAAHQSLTGLLLGILYTAALAPVILWPLQRLRRAFAFTPNRKGMR